MELRTQAADKILEALAPALAAELEKVLQEARQQQEEEFRKRLEAAIRDAEQAATAARDKLAADMQQQAEQAVQQATESVRSESAQQLQAAGAQWEAEKARLQAQVDLWRTYAEGQRQLAESSSQTEMLTRFLNLVQPFASAVAVYVAKADGLAMWKSRGQGAFPEVVSKSTIDPELFFKPLVVRDRTVAAVCAAPPYQVEPLDFLATCLGRSIEAFGMKLQSPAPKSPAPSASSSVAAASAAPAGNDEKLAGEARLAARLLVSEIKLYNEQDVKDGRTSSDLYTRLQKQIDQGRDQYQQRIEAAGGNVSRDYYHDELVRVLADGEASRLGANYPGPRP